MPGSQDSVIDSAFQFRSTTQTAPPAPAPPSMPNSRRPLLSLPKQQLREYLRCAQCGSDPAAFRAVSTTSCCTWPETWGQQLLQKALGNCANSTVLLVQPAASRWCSAEVILHSKTILLATPCKTDGSPTLQQPSQSSLPVPPSDPSTTARSRTVPFATLFSQSKTCWCCRTPPSFCDGTKALIPWSSGFSTHPTSADSVEAARIALGWVESTERSESAIHSGKKENTAAKQVSRRSPGSTGERQKACGCHFVSFAGTGQRKSLFQSLDIFDN